MHIQTLDAWEHNHDFAVIHGKGERRTNYVLIMTAITMIVEIIAGIAFGSMALLADGWHMGTHVAAFIITIFAYKYSKKHQNTSRFTFGPGKVTVLGGFASAIALLVVALVMSIESIQRIFSPQNIHFNEAIGVAALGLFVNIVCAFILQDHHDHPHESNNHHYDHNLKAAYLHVLADALTSVLAIVALLFGKMFGWNWLDPIMGIVGALVITRWSLSLLKETSPILLDETIEENKKLLIKAMVESDSDNRICDLHVWKVGPNDYAAVVSLVTHFPKPVEHYKGLLSGIHNLSHITIEINQCMSEPCIAPKTGVA
jgi:cation diffusion facilitator family transporter